MFIPIANKSYTFSGSPSTFGPSVEAHRSDAYARGQQAAAQGQTMAAANNAAGNILSTLYQQPANFANVYGGAFNAYAGGLGNLATSMANERSSLYGANAMAEAARQGAIGNIGSAGLGAYGSASNAAMNAWAQNQAAYNQSLALMHGSNQSALAGLSPAYGQIGAADSRAGAARAIAGSLMGGSGGGLSGSMSANGLSGPLAAGSYRGSGGGEGGRIGGGGEGGGSGGSLNALAGLARSMNSNASDAMRRLDSQHLSSRNMPGQLLDQSYAGLQKLTGQNLDALGSGMNQFYGNQQHAGNQFMDGMRGLRGDLNAGYGKVGTQIEDMWNRSLGRTQFLTPAQQYSQAREAEALRHQRLRDIYQESRGIYSGR